MMLRRQGAFAAIVAAGLMLGFGLGTVATAAPGTHSDDSNYADAIAAKQAERAALQAQQDSLDSALEDTNAAIVDANNKLNDLEAQLPIAQAELATAESDLEIATQHQKETEAQLAAAQAEDDRITQQMATDSARLDSLRAMVAELAREAYRGEGTDSTLTLVLGAKTIQDFVDDFTAEHAMARTQGNALAEMEQIAAMNRNRGARQSAVRDYMAALKVLADQYVAQAEDARARAEQKKAEIEDLLAQQQQLTQYLEDQKAAYMQQQADLDAAQQQLKEDLAALIRAQRGSGAQFWDGTWGYPVAHPYITSSYGMRLHPIFHVWRLHAGTDFRAYCGSPVLAAADGWVEWAKYRSGYGNQLLINHGTINGVSYMTSYNHLSSFNVSPNDFVLRGDVVAFAGSTGDSTGCHLHFEIYVNGNTVDPMTLLPPL